MCGYLGKKRGNEIVLTLNYAITLLIPKELTETFCTFSSRNPTFALINIALLYFQNVVAILVIQML